MSITPSSLSPFKRETALEATQNALRNAILTGQLRPGERLDPTTLASQLEVSLTPVRNALQLLAAEGLVEIKPRSGTYVAQLSVTDVAETFEIRRAMECLAAEKAAQNLTPAQLGRLGHLLEKMNAPVKDEQDRDEHQKNNAEFHRLILEAAQNRRLLEIYAELNAHMRIARIHATAGDWRSRLKQEREEHEAIVAALQSRNAAQAVAAMRTHIDRACASLIASLEQETGAEAAETDRLQER